MDWNIHRHKEALAREKWMAKQLAAHDLGGQVKIYENGGVMWIKSRQEFIAWCAKEDKAWADHVARGGRVELTG